MLGYLAYLGYSQVTRSGICINNDIISKEIAKADGLGIACIYNSVILTMFLGAKYGSDKVRMVQGIYRLKAREDSPIAQLFGETQMGFHAFVEFDGAIFDTTIVSQQEMFFDFKHIPVLTGNIPDGLDLFGCREGYDIIHTYAKDFPKWSGIDIDQWTDMHLKAMESLVI